MIWRNIPLVECSISSEIANRPLISSITSKTVTMTSISCMDSTLRRFKSAKREYEKTNDIDARNDEIILESLSALRERGYTKTEKRRSTKIAEKVSAREVS